MSRPSIYPVAWQCPPAPARSRQPAGPEPFPHSRLIPLPATGEDVVVDGAGRLLCGLAGGAIVRLDPARGEIEKVGDTGGRPLGLEPLADGRVLVCDSQRGLLALDPATGRLEVLVSEVGGVPLRFCSNAAAQSDGTIWFTESTSRFDFEYHVADILEHGGAGRLFRRDPGGSVDVVMSGLQFANGLALTADESALVFAETGAYQLSRIPTSGAVGNPAEIIAANLPGMPDNLSRGRDGIFWVALVAPRNPLLDALSGHPWLRRLVWAIPPALQPKPARTAWVMAFTAAGELVCDLQGALPDFYATTGVVEHDGTLYLASLAVPALLAVDLGRP